MVISTPESRLAARTPHLCKLPEARSEPPAARQIAVCRHACSLLLSAGMVPSDIVGLAKNGSAYCDVPLLDKLVVFHVSARCNAPCRSCAGAHRGMVLPDVPSNGIADNVQNLVHFQTFNANDTAVFDLARERSKGGFHHGAMPLSHLYSWCAGLTAEEIRHRIGRKATVSYVRARCTDSRALQQHAADQSLDWAGRFQMPNLSQDTV